MKEDFGNFITETIAKMDKSLVMILIPLAIIMYLVFFVSNAEFEKLLGIEPHIDKQTIICPHCNTPITIEYNKDTFVIVHTKISSDKP